MLCLGNNGCVKYVRPGVESREAVALNRLEQMLVLDQYSGRIKGVLEYN